MDSSGQTIKNTDTIQNGDEEDRVTARWSDYALTYMTNIGLIGAVVLSYRLAYTNFGEMGFAQYALLRRTIAFLAPLLSMGLAVSIPRRVAAAKYETNTCSPVSYLGGSLICGFFAIILFLIPLYFFPKQIAYVFFGDSSYSTLIKSIIPVFIGSILHVNCYAYFRGKMWIRRANTLLFINVGIIPLGALIIAEDMGQIFTSTGFAISIVSILGIISIFIIEGSCGLNVIGPIKRLLSFGLPRVPGDLALSAILILPVTLTAHFYGAQQAGLVAYGITLLTLAQTVVSPIGIILLPEATSMIRAGMMNKLKSRIAKLLIASMVVSITGVVIFEIGTEWFLALHLGNYANELPRITRLIILAVVPYNIYVCLRSLIDAGMDRASNTRNCCLALIVFCFVILCDRLFLQSNSSLLIALFVSFATLALLTCTKAWKILHPESPYSIQNKNVTKTAISPHIDFPYRDHVQDKIESICN